MIINMKKNKLIEILNNIEGNPDIFLWNGMVGDFMDIDPQVCENYLSRQKFKDYCDFCEMRDARDENRAYNFNFSEDQIKEFKNDYNKYIKWEYNQWMAEDNDDYNKKTIYLINAKPRGISTWDRLGKISY